MQIMSQSLSSRMFFGDWLYKEYKLSRKDCRSFVPNGIAFSAFANSKLKSVIATILQYIREFIFEQFSSPDFATNITLAPLLQIPMKTSYSNSLVKPFVTKQSQIASII